MIYFVLSIIGIIISPIILATIILSIVIVIDYKITEEYKNGYDDGYGTGFEVGKYIKKLHDEDLVKVTEKELKELIITGITTAVSQAITGKPSLYFGKITASEIAEKTVKEFIRNEQ